jgi:acetate---CoA ligase (ADP-forming)
MSDFTRHMVRNVLEATAAVVVGASDDPQQFGGRAFRYLKEQFSGSVYPVNPRRTVVQGSPAFPTVGDAPAATLAVIALPAAHVAGAVEECGVAGIRWAVVFASGFSDVGPEGLRLQHELVQRARAAGVRIIGPNSMGIINVASGLAATFAARIADIELRAGGLAVVSQSGATGSALLSELAEAAVPCRYFVHTGNEADLTTADVLDAYADDPAVEVVAVYLETVRDPAAFTSSLAAAAGRGLPVVTLVAGTTPSGAAAAASHTGSLVQSDDALLAVLEAYGVLRVGSPSELVDVTKCLVVGPRPKGRRTAVVTLSGGGGVLQADAASACGLDLPSPSGNLRGRLAEVLPSFASSANPFDLTGAPVAQPAMLADSLEAIADSAEYDVISVVLAAGERAAAAFTDIVAGLASMSSASVIATWQGVDPTTLHALAARGVPTFGDPVRAVHALASVVRLSERPRVVEPVSGATPADGPPGRVPRDAESLGGWLRLRGVPVAATMYLRTRSGVTAVPDVLGPGPYVAKLDVSGINHRSDIGAVRLGICSAETLARTVDELLELASRRTSDADLAAEAQPKVQVQRQEPPGHEVLVGLRRDEQFGWMLAVGFGGVLTEVVGEVAVVPAPASPDTCIRMIRSLFDGRWVTHRRGLGERGAEALASLASRVSALAPSMDCTELELNPVIVREGRAVAVDWMAAG